MTERQVVKVHAMVRRTRYQASVSVVTDAQFVKGNSKSKNMFVFEMLCAFANTLNTSCPVYNPKAFADRSKRAHKYTCFSSKLIQHE